MPLQKPSNRIITAFATLLLLLSVCPSSLAQGPISDAPTPPAAVAPTFSFLTPPQASENSHKFWDGQNKILFLAVAASSGADFAVTRSNLRAGGRELNPVVRMFGRSDAGLALNFAGETAGSVAISYFFHKTGHHKMERLVSYVNIGASAGAVSYGLSHR